MNQYLDIHGTRLAVRDHLAGQGSTVFLWGHCLLGSMAQDDEAALIKWHELEKGARVVRYDVRGHGDSKPCRSEEAFHFSELSHDVVDLADQLGVGRFAMGGVSLGSALSLHTAVAFPERITAMVLMAPPTAWDLRRKQAALYRRVATAIRVGGMIPLRLAGSISPIAGGLLNHDDDRSPASLLMGSTVVNVGKMDRRSVMAALRGAAASNLPEPEALRKIYQPTLILGWHDDSSHPVAIAESLADLIPNSELHFADKLEAVRGWTPLVQSFLAEHG